MISEMRVAADKWFPRIDPGYDNAIVIEKFLGMKLATDIIAEHLGRIENISTAYWWEDEKLLGFLNMLHNSGLLPWPDDAITRLRWIALVLICAAIEVGFSYGNVLIPPDYLPDSELEEWADYYGWNVIESIQDLRKNLEVKGWSSVMGVTPQ